jgi:hypothetical protein
MAEQLDGALDEAARSVLSFVAERSSLAKGCLDDVVLLSDNNGPWVANQAARAPPLERNHHFQFKAAQFGGT